MVDVSVGKEVETQASSLCCPIVAQNQIRKLERGDAVQEQPLDTCERSEGGEGPEAGPEKRLLGPLPFFPGTPTAFSNPTPPPTLAAFSL